MSVQNPASEGLITYENSTKILQVNLITDGQINRELWPYDADHTLRQRRVKGERAAT